MCGRYATTRSAADLSALFEALDQTSVVEPRYNVAPTDQVPVVRVSREHGERVLTLARWGLLPHWARDPKVGARMINARAETVATARAYAESFATRRALVPADGWYEWLRDGAGGRQAYFMTPADGDALAMAGLWSAWGPDRLVTFSVVTVPAVGPFAAVHDRMPLVLPPGRWRQWLATGAPSGPSSGPSSGPAPAEALLAAPPPEFLAGLEIRPVGPAVGNVRNDGPELVTRVDASPPGATSQQPLF